MKVASIVLVISCSLAQSSLCQGLSISLDVRPRACKIGDKVAFSITYRNLSNHPVAINPTYRAYEGLDVKLTNTTSKQQAKLVTYMSVDFDEDQVRRGLITLKAGQTHIVKHVATIMASLPSKPSPWSDGAVGVFIVFSDSALKLPGFGAFNVTTRYVALRETGLRLGKKDQKIWWVGETKANPVTVQIAR